MDKTDKKELILKQITFNNGLQFDIMKKNDVKFQKWKLGTTLHWHDHFEMEFIYSGEAIHLLNDREYKINAGCAYLMTPSDFHTLLPAESASLSLYSIRFGDSVLSRSVYEAVMRPSNPLTARFDDAEFEEIRHMLDEILGEVRNKQQGYEDMCSLIINMLVLKLLRRYTADTETVTQTDSFGSSALTVQQAIAHIKYNFRNDGLSIRAIADYLHITPNYFGEIFRRETGVSCNTYIKNTRLRFASGLLVNSDLPVSEVAYRSGFSSVSYFIKEFKQSFGVPPKQYRDTAHSNQNA